MVLRTRLTRIALVCSCCLIAAPFSAYAEPSAADYVPGQAIVLYRTGDGVNPLSEGSDNPLAAAGFDVEQVWDFSDADSSISLQSADSAANGTDIPEGDDIRVALVEGEEGSTEELISELEDLDCVIAAQPNSIAALAAVEPNDTYYQAWQYSLHDDDEAGISAATAWERDEQTVPDDAKDNVVAVIDTGVNFSNPDLAAVAWTSPGDIGLTGEHGYDFHDNDSDPTPGTSSVLSHGTHCAGIIAATTDNEQGIAGVAQHTKIMACKVAADDGEGAIFLSSAISAYQYIVQARLAGENIVAVNNSWSQGGKSPVLDYLINQAGKLGILSVFAAGNDSSDIDNQPASENASGTVHISSPYAIFVAASNGNNEIASYSNWDETDVDVAAPGSNILSTVATASEEAYYNVALTDDDVAYQASFGTDIALDDISWTIYNASDGEVLAEGSGAGDAQSPVHLELATSALTGDPALRVSEDLSRTSMATPVIAGSVAELASLYPDEIALELRGRIVGSTEPLENADEHPTATNGRFTFETACGDDEDISANTWAAESNAAEGTITLLGRGLNDATATVDGKAARVVERNDDSLVVEVDDEVFDDCEHDIVVTDASTGKTHTAAYTIAAEDLGASLHKVADLPVDAASESSATLIGAPDRLLYLDTLGAYAYQIVNPQSEGAHWEQLSAPGMPWGDEAPTDFRTLTLSYALLGRKLYAFAADKDVVDDVTYLVFYMNELDVDGSGSWGAWREIDRSEIMTPIEGYLLSYSAATADARVCFAVTVNDAYRDEERFTNGDVNHLITVDAQGKTDHIVSTPSTTYDSVARLVGCDDIRALGVDLSRAEPLNTLDALTFDPDTERWSATPLTGIEELTLASKLDITNSLVAAVRNGAVHVGTIDGNAGDLTYLDLQNGTAVSLGTLGLATTPSTSASGVAMAGDTLYLTCLTSDDSGAAGGLYALASEAVPELAANEATVAARADAGGTATVDDGLGAAKATDRVAVGDVATWRAVAQQGHAFAGWYDADGTLVSTEETFTAEVTGATELTARFNTVDTPGEDDPGHGGDADDPGAGGHDADSNEDPADSTKRPVSSGNASGSMPATGDTAPILIGGAVTLGAIAVVAGIIIRRRR